MDDLEYERLDRIRHEIDEIQCEGLPESEFTDPFWW